MIVESRNCSIFPIIKKTIIKTVWRILSEVLDTREEIPIKNLGDPLEVKMALSPTWTRFNHNKFKNAYSHETAAVLPAWNEP